MNYNLNDNSAQQEKTSTLRSLRNLLQLIREERKNLLLSLFAILSNSGLNLLGPFIIGYTIDTYVVHKNFHGVLIFSGILLIMYMLAFMASYQQTKIMGGVGQSMQHRNVVIQSRAEDRSAEKIQIAHQNQIGFEFGDRRAQARCVVSHATANLAPIGQRLGSASHPRPQELE